MPCPPHVSRLGKYWSFNYLNKVGLSFIFWPPDPDFYETSLTFMQQIKTCILSIKPWGSHDT